MEDHGIFEIGNPIHLYALHHIFLKIIDSDLKHWCATHNGHRIRTEGHKTPMQLWISSSIQNANELRVPQCTTCFQEKVFQLV